MPVTDKTNQTYDSMTFLNRHYYISSQLMPTRRNLSL